MIFRATLFAVLLSAPALAQTNFAWQTVGTPGFSDWATICSRISADANGNVYVAYQDLTPGLGARVTVMKRNSSAWQVVGVKGAASIGAGYYCNMAFDAQNALLVASRDYGHAARAGVRRYDAATNSWSTLGSAIGTGEAHWVDLAVTADGKACVAYADASVGNRSTAMKYDAGAWSPIGSAGYSVTSTSYDKITIAPDGTLYSAFSDNAHLDAAGTGKGSVMRFDPASSTWNYVGAPGFTAFGAGNITLTIDRLGVPWIAYYRYHANVFVQRFDGTSWVNVGGSPCGADVPTVDSEGWRQWLSLQFDSQNRPYIAYQLFHGGGRAVVRRLEGNDWSLVGHWGFTPGAADYLSMIVDAQDVPWVTYRDGAHGQRISVMRYVPVSESYCVSTPNSQGCLSSISSTGAPSLSNATPFVIRAGNVINQSFGVLVYGFQPVAEPLGSGILCVGGLRRLSIATSGGAVGTPNCTGLLQHDFAYDLVSGLPSVWIGTQLHTQFWYRDATSPARFAMSDGLRFTVGL